MFEKIAFLYIKLPVSSDIGLNLHNMIEQVEPGNVLFLDIETVSDKPAYDALDETFQELWRIKSRSVRKSSEEADEAEIAASYKDRAAIFAEFGRIICISVGSLRREKESGKLTVRLTSFYGHDEKALLEDFSRLIQQHYGDPLSLIHI